MEAIEVTSLLHEQQLRELKILFDKRNQQLAEGFQRALTSVQISEVLQVMRGADMLPWCLEHIRQITSKILNGDAEDSLEQAYRTISQLKAQQAILKMEVQLGKKKQQDSKRAKELQEQLRHSQVECQMLRDQSPSVKLSEMVEKEIKRRIAIIEKEYILRAEHERIVAQFERQLRQHQRNGMKSPERQTSDNEKTLRQILTDKYEQALKRQQEKHQTEVDQLKGLIRQLEKDLSLASILNNSLHQTSKLTNGVISSLSENTISHAKYPVRRSQDRNNEEQKKVESPRTKDSSPTKQESNHTYFTDNQLKSKFSQNHQNDGAQKSPVSRISLERQKSGTKFEEIQASFAKELAQLRTRMSEKREKLCSPDSTYLKTRIAKNKQEPYNRRLASQHIVAGGYQRPNRH